MTEVLQNKNLATRFQILAEIAANQPNLQQKDIARKLNITPQAVSEHIIRLEEEGWVVSEGRSRYKVTQVGVNWVLKGSKHSWKPSMSLSETYKNSIWIYQVGKNHVLYC